MHIAASLIAAFPLKRLYQNMCLVRRYDCQLWWCFCLHYLAFTLRNNCSLWLSLDPPPYRAFNNISLYETHIHRFGLTVGCLWVSKESSRFPSDIPWIFSTIWRILYNGMHNIVRFSDFHRIFYILVSVSQQSCWFSWFSYF